VTREALFTVDPIASGAFNLRGNCSYIRLYGCMSNLTNIAEDCGAHKSELL
jgi:hypothetical protein